MGTQKRTLDFRRPIQTRGGSNVKLYEIFDGRYINGAYYADDIDVWFPCQWDSAGYYANKPSALDLVNVKQGT